ncbi:MAG: hypothetical protein RBQ94_01265 [Methanimicrococcus sp.]|nr:hypothetical protein [Methanimicrococcus sp.]
MIKVTDNEFPHPILYYGKDDYISGSFDIKLIRHQEIGDDFIFTFQYYLEDCQGLQEMIEQGDAVVSFRLISSSSSFREIHKFGHSNEIEIKINKYSISKVLSVIGFIVSSENDYLFSLKEHNPEYFSNLTFTLRKGDILAITDELKIRLDDSEFRRPVSSIFTIVIDPDLPASEQIRCNYDRNIIQIQLCPEIYETYSLMKKAGRQKEANVSIVYPVLVELLCYMPQWGIDSEYSDYTWWRVIENKYRVHYSNNLFEQEYILAVSVANKLLGFIAETSLKYFADLESLDVFENDEES